MYQIIMIVCNQTIYGKIYNDFDELTDELYKLRTTAKNNNFPAIYKFKCI